MQLLALAVLALAFFGLDQAWKRGRIRASFAALGRTDLEIRWLPFVGSSWLRARRDASTFRVSFTAPGGERLACLCVASLRGEVALQEERRVPAVGASAGRSIRMSLAPEARRDADVRGALRFHAACAAAAFAVFAAMGASYWSVPYRALRLPDGLYGFGLVALLASACGLGLWRPRRWVAVLLWETSAVVAVVGVRIAFDLSGDPGSHGLLGIEIAIALFVGAVASAIGLGIARLTRRVAAPAASSPR